ncbi:DUF559 domain-containing protein [bacterium]|nr:DUF559 domain-containing protein [bacterium]
MGKLYNRRAQKEKRQYLRNNATKAEQLLWLQLKGSQLGVKFRRQHGIGRFILDFYCPEIRLALEADGYTHESPEAKIRDRERQSCIETYKIHFLRFTDEEIAGNMEKVLATIKHEIARLTKIQ